MINIVRIVIFLIVGGTLHAQTDQVPIPEKFVKYLNLDSVLIAELPESNENERTYKREFRNSLDRLHENLEEFFKRNYSDGELQSLMKRNIAISQMQPAVVQIVEQIISQYSIQIGMEVHAMQMTKLRENFEKPLSDCSSMKVGKFRVVTSDFIDLEIQRLGNIELRIYGQDTTRNAIHWTGPCSYSSTYLNSQYNGKLSTVIYNIEGDRVEMVEMDSNYPEEYVHLLGTKL